MERGLKKKWSGSVEQGMKKMERSGGAGYEKNGAERWSNVCKKNGDQLNGELSLSGEQLFKNS